MAEQTRRLPTSDEVAWGIVVIGLLLLFLTFISLEWAVHNDCNDDPASYACRSGKRVRVYVRFLTAAMSVVVLVAGAYEWRRRRKLRGRPADYTLHSVL